MKMYSGFFSMMVGASALFAQDPAAHTVIVPYDMTQPIQEQKAERFYLPYESFQKLWLQAKESRRVPLVESDVQQTVIHTALYQARLEEKGLALEVKMDVVSRGDWTKLPLPFKNGESSLLVGEVRVDGKAAALNEGAVVLESPGRHQIELTAMLPMESDWQEVKLTIPRALSGMMALKASKSEGWLRVNQTPALSVDETAEGRVFTAVLGDTDRLDLQRSPRGMDRGEGPVASATVKAELYLKSFQRDSLVSYLLYEFPGSVRRTFRFSVENSATADALELTSLMASSPDLPGGVAISRVVVRQEGTRRIHELSLSREVSNSLRLSISGDVFRRNHESRRAVPCLEVEATRLVEQLSVHHEADVEVKVEPAEGQKRIPGKAKGSLAEVAYEQSGRRPLFFTATPRVLLGKSAVDYVYQLSPQKVELLATLSLQRKLGLWTHAQVMLPPGGYEVQSLNGPALKTWQHEGDTLYLHLDPQIAGQDARVIVHLARALPQANTLCTLEPLGFVGFEKTSGKILIAAHAASDVKLPDLTQVKGLKEVDASVLDSVFVIAPPLEKKRALEYEGIEWTLEVPLTQRVARFTAETVALVLVSDAGIRLSQQVAFQVTQGAVRQVSVRLPATLPEAVVTGPLLREMRTRVVGAERIYDCSFQTDVLDHAELTFDHDLPLGADLVVPFVQVSNAEQLTRYFVTDNLSAREANVSEKTALETVARAAVPYLPTDLSRPQFYRATGEGVLQLTFQQLTATEGTAALVTLADITTVLRADGERWDTIVYSLLNRSLQFLPVTLPEGAELIAASVSGESVRADEEKRDGRTLKLIPLIQTKPGQRALEVRLVCRFRALENELKTHFTFDDPELPGLSIERTAWTVWTPQDNVVRDFDGNMEEVGEEGVELQKLEGMLSELGDVNRELATGKLGYDDAKEAYSRASSLADSLAKNKERLVSRARGFKGILIEKGRYEQKQSSNDEPAQDQMDLDVSQQRKLLDGNWNQYASKSEVAVVTKSGVKAETAWSFNGNDLGQTQSLNTFKADTLIQKGAQVMNDNLAVNNDFFATGNSTVTISGGVSGIGALSKESTPQFGQMGLNTINIGNARANNLSQVSEARENKSEPNQPQSPAAVPAPVTSQKRAQTASAPKPANRGGFGAGAMAADSFGPVTAEAPVDVLAAPAAPGKAAEPESEMNRLRSEDMAANAFMKTGDGRLSLTQQVESLRATGRRSLLIEVPTVGQVRHFTKLKDHAILELELDSPWDLEKILSGCLLSVGLLGFAAWTWQNHQRARV